MNEPPSLSYQARKLHPNSGYYFDHDLSAHPVNRVAVMTLSQSPRFVSLQACCATLCTTNPFKWNLHLTMRARCHFRSHHIRYQVENMLRSRQERNKQDSILHRDDNQTSGRNLASPFNFKSVHPVVEKLKQALEASLIDSMTPVARDINSTAPLVANNIIKI